MICEIVERKRNVLCDNQLSARALESQQEFIGHDLYFVADEPLHLLLLDENGKGFGDEMHAVIQ